MTVISRSYIVNQYFTGGKAVTLEMMVDFEHRKVTGDVVLKYSGEKKRFRCDSFDQAMDWFNICKEWAMGVREDGNAVWDLDEDDESEDDGEEDDE